MRALVTGSAGFVGRRFVARLRLAGWTVDALDTADFPPADCRLFFAQPEHPHYDLVIHCAAVVGGRETIQGDPLAVAANLAIDSDLFRWALRARPDRIVYFSSSAAYPVALQVGMDARALRESDIDLDEPYFGIPDRTYGWGKLTGELLTEFAEAEGLRVHVFRPFSGYGEDQDPAYPFRAFVDRALRREDPFDVWGKGTQVRDFIHIDDIVDAVGEAVDQDVPGPLNLAWGIPVQMADLAVMVCREVGYTPEIRFVGDKPTGPSYRVADVTKLSTVYRPRIDIEEGIRRGVRASTLRLAR